MALEQLRVAGSASRCIEPVFAVTSNSQWRYLIFQRPLHSLDIYGYRLGTPLMKRRQNIIVRIFGKLEKRSSTISSDTFQSIMLSLLGHSVRAKIAKDVRSRSKLDDAGAQDPPPKVIPTVMWTLAWQSRRTGPCMFYLWSLLWTVGAFCKSLPSEPYSPRPQVPWPRRYR